MRLQPFETFFLKYWQFLVVCWHRLSSKMNSWTTLPHEATIRNQLRLQSHMSPPEGAIFIRILLLSSYCWKQEGRPKVSVATDITSYLIINHIAVCKWTKTRHIVFLCVLAAVELLDLMSNLWRCCPEFIWIFLSVTFVVNYKTNDTTDNLI